MSDHIPTRLDAFVRNRANEVCEYCLLPQFTQEATFHIDHVAPRKQGGLTVEGNLALACVTCSLRKSARTQALDPLSRRILPLFNPRTDRWVDHFRWTRTWRLSARSAIGRATIAALGMNRPAIVKIRRNLALLGLFPP